ncbi:MAG: ATP-binding protein [Coxiellaceae bacterium]|nr:ATP-binding protein [Coxiellaceae bacterium]
MADIVAHYQSTKIKLSYECVDASEVVVSFDAKLLKHAIENIITNALKFARHKIAVTLQASPDEVRIAIDDDGPGIPEADREKVFEPFATLNSIDDYQKHMGLGLAIAKSVVALHSGSISIQSSALGGCKLAIDLPRSII